MLTIELNCGIVSQYCEVSSVVTISPVLMTSISVLVTWQYACVNSSSSRYSTEQLSSRRGNRLLSRPSDSNNSNRVIILLHMVIHISRHQDTTTRLTMSLDTLAPVSSSTKCYSRRPLVILGEHTVWSDSQWGALTVH